MDAYLDWKGWAETEFGRLQREDALAFACELRAAGLPSVRDLEILELGFGNGAFAAYVRQQGGCWTGREVHPELQRRAREAGYRTIEPGEPLRPQSGEGGFDLIAAFDVLEHLDLAAVRAFLAEAREALQRGGLLLLRVPSGDSPFSGYVFHGDLTHRTLLGSLAVRQLAREAGLEVRQLRSPKVPILGLGPLRALRRMAALALQSCVYGILRRFLVAQAGAVLTPDLVAVLQRPEAAR